MDFLEEEVKGQKEPYSTVLLSLKLQIPISESEKLLKEYYEQNRDSIDVSYKQIIVENNKTSMRIVGKAQLNKNAQSTKIYAVSLARASDPAVLVGITKRCRETLNKLRIGDLESIGLTVNSLLEKEFKICSQPASLLSGKQNTSWSPSTHKETSISKPLEKSTRDVALTEEKADNKREPKELPLEKKQPETNKEPTKHVPEKKAFKRVSAFPFEKIDKAKALKTSMFKPKPLLKPVTEKIVITESNGDDEEDENLEDDRISSIHRSNHEEELKNLEEKLWNEHHDGPDTFQSDPDAQSIQFEQDGELFSDQEINADERMDLDSESPEPDQNVSIDHKTDIHESNIGIDESPQASSNDDMNKSKPETNRIQRTREIEDEFGFKQSITEWIEVPVNNEKDDSGSNLVGTSVNKSLTLPSNPNSAPERNTKANNSVNTATPKASLEHKLPTQKIGSNRNVSKSKQGTLMNFFKPKNSKK